MCAEPLCRNSVDFCFSGDAVCKQIITKINNYADIHSYVMIEALCPFDLIKLRVILVSQPINLIYDLLRSSYKIVFETYALRVNRICRPK